MFFSHINISLLLALSPSFPLPKVNEIKRNKGIKLQVMGGEPAAMGHHFISFITDFLKFH